ncbi:SRPBCC family protein [Mesorhizobium sp. CC13]|uniref:SRPBCC family protein n=1 Tax=Mesorhizobium sp. CC13 TaxID=3029194 RepID=UPI003266BCA8
MNKMLVEAPEGEPIVRMTRTFDAPRALVWRAWTRPEHVARWWGSRAMGTTRVIKLDLRPGGEWRFEHTMHDGAVFNFFGRYIEVDEPEKLVNTFALEGMFEDKPVVETHRFEEIDGKTRYTGISRFDSIEDRDGMVASGMEAGAQESMNQLEELLGELVSA